MTSAAKTITATRTGAVRMPGPVVVVAVVARRLGVAGRAVAVQRVEPQPDRHRQRRETRPRRQPDLALPHLGRDPRRAGPGQDQAPGGAPAVAAQPERQRGHRDRRDQAPRERRERGLLEDAVHAHLEVVVDLPQAAERARPAVRRDDAVAQELAVARGRRLQVVDLVGEDVDQDRGDLVEQQRDQGARRAVAPGAGIAGRRPAEPVGGGDRADRDQEPEQRPARLPAQPDPAGQGERRDLGVGDHVGPAGRPAQHDRAVDDQRGRGRGPDVAEQHPAVEAQDREAEADDPGDQPGAGPAEAERDAGRGDHAQEGEQGQRPAHRGAGAAIVAEGGGDQPLGQAARAVVAGRHLGARVGVGDRGPAAGASGPVARAPAPGRTGPGRPGWPPRGRRAPAPARPAPWRPRAGCGTGPGRRPASPAGSHRPGWPSRGSSTAAARARTQSGTSAGRSSRSMRPSHGGPRPYRGGRPVRKAEATSDPGGFLDRGPLGGDIRGDAR